MYREQEASALITSSSLIERTSQSELRGISQGYLKAAGGLQGPSMCQGVKTCQRGFHRKRYRYRHQHQFRDQRIWNHSLRHWEDWVSPRDRHRVPMSSSTRPTWHPRHSARPTRYWYRMIRYPGNCQRNTGMCLNWQMGMSGTRYRDR